MTGEREIQIDETQTYDSFLSFAGPDRDVGRALTAELSRLGLRVFFDENIAHFSSITDSITEGLQNSRTLLAYYSEHFTDRRASQLELTAAFLGGQQQGDPSRRIIVINPHNTSDHIAPAELATSRYAIQTHDKTDLATLALAVRERVAGATGTMKENIPSLTRQPEWHGSMPNSYKLLGRYPEAWQLHSALSRPDTYAQDYGPVVSLTGLRGIGKTALAALYAARFGAAFLGGVYWTKLDPQYTQGEMLEDYVRQSLEITDQPATMADREHGQVLSSLADHLAAKEAASLWIIDDIPDEFDPKLLQRLLLPHPQVHSLLIGHEAVFSPELPTVKLGPFSQRDARNLLMGYRPPKDDSESEEINRLIDHLGGNPGALTLAGQYLEDRPGLVSYAQYRLQLP